jgi:hypothetical protein
LHRPIDPRFSGRPSCRCSVSLDLQQGQRDCCPGAELRKQSTIAPASGLRAGIDGSALYLVETDSPQVAEEKAKHPTLPCEAWGHWQVEII